MGVFPPKLCFWNVYLKRHHTLSKIKLTSFWKILAPIFCTSIHKLYFYNNSLTFLNNGFDDVFRYDHDSLYYYSFSYFTPFCNIGVFWNVFDKIGSKKVIITQIQKDLTIINNSFNWSENYKFVAVVIDEMGYSKNEDRLPHFLNFFF